MSLAPNSLAARDVAYTLHHYTNLAAHEEKGPFIITRGEGVYVYDDQDKKYMEGMAGLWCTGLGFSEKRLTEAAKKQLDTLPFSQSFTHRAVVPTIELAEKLISIAPEPLAKAYFVNSGSEAVDTAIKFVWYYNNALGRPDKKKIISRKCGYHGVTIAAASLSALAYAQDGWDVPLERFLSTETPHYYRHGEPGESEEDFATRLADILDKQIEAEGPDTVGGFIAEPIMGAGGVLMPPKTYFEKIQKVLKKHDVLMIADEVICGFGRTGDWFACDTYGIKPDIMTCAKQLTSAYIPMGAVMISNKLYDAFFEYSNKLGMFGTGNTYGGHPVAAAVGLATLKVYEDDNILAHVKSVANPFAERLNQLLDHPLVGHVRSVGLIGGIELVKDKATKESYPPANKTAFMAVAKVLAEGLVVRALPGDILGVCPPLIINEDEINELFDRLTRGLDAAKKELG